MKYAEGLLYTNDHEWVKIEGNVAYVGISDYAQDSLGDIVYVELPEVDDDIEKGEEIAVVESTKAASDIFAPISGKIIEVNEALDDEPELINADAFANWMVKLEISGDPDTEGLLSTAEYKAMCEKE